MSKLLKMFLSGPVGTEKSRVINPLRAFFEGNLAHPHPHHETDDEWRGCGLELLSMPH